jgi:hypothetical protein
MNRRSGSSEGVITNNVILPLSSLFTSSFSSQCDNFMVLLYATILRCLTYVIVTELLTSILGTKKRLLCQNRRISFKTLGINWK